VNKQRIVGSARLTPGDTIQFGPSGPEFQFDLDPRPEHLVGITREVPFTPQVMPTTRGDIPPIEPTPRTSVGKATVERMIAERTQSQSRQYLLGGGAALMALIVLIAGLMVYQKRPISQTQGELSRTRKELGETKKIVREMEEDKPLTAAQIAEKNTPSVVFIEVGWKLIYTPTGSQVYHKYILNRKRNGQPIIPNGQEYVPLYLEVGREADREIEPWLVTDSQFGRNRVIGGEHRGAGFVVSSAGHIMTNRHIVAPWMDEYQFPTHAANGVLAEERDGGIVLKDIVDAPMKWIPRKSKQIEFKLQGGLEGRLDYRYVTFANSENRIRFEPVQEHPHHDVAVIKISLQKPLQEVKINDNYESIKSGTEIVSLGYPGASAPTFGLSRSFDPSRSLNVSEVPAPTVGKGVIGKVVRDVESSDRSKRIVYSPLGDAYELSIPNIGPGSSGGPIFDDQGRVVGIVSFGRVEGGVRNGYAIPIHFGREIM
jgi:S1-C subfamily serine protease